jgi:hypothetical protein
MLEMIRKMKAGRILGGVRVLALLAGLIGCLLAESGCNPYEPKPTPPEANPSVVVTRDGIAFYVKGCEYPEPGKSCASS